MTRTPRTLRVRHILIACVVLGAGLGWLLVPGRPEADTLTYSEFRERLGTGRVESVVMIGSDWAEGALVDGRKYRVLLPTRHGEGLLTELEARGVRIEARREGGAWLGMAAETLFLALAVGVLVYLIRLNRRQHVSQTQVASTASERPTTTFAQVAGADEAKADLAEIVSFLKSPSRFGRLGGRLPKGVLLMGPPGTGKTMLARAVAGEADVPFLGVSGSSFVEMFVGVGAARVRDLFKTAQSLAPCIVFIDEIDAVGRQRGAGVGGGHDEREQTLNQMLVAMDGFDNQSGVIVLAATNRPDVLDPALLRPGRFDRRVEVGLPDVKGREAILRVHARKVRMDGGVDLAVVARGTPGMAGADLANVCNEAALAAGRRGADSVAMEDFEAARDKILFGAERSSMVLSDYERRITAYHEAGHAVVALTLPGLDPVHKISIIPRGSALGIMASLPSEDRNMYSRSWLRAHLVMLFGGRVAEEMILGPDGVTTGAANDIERATDVARRMVSRFGMSEAVGLMAVGDKESEVFLGRELTQSRRNASSTAELVDTEVRGLIDEARDRAREILAQERDLMEALARELLEHENLERADVERITRLVRASRRAAELTA
jgi:cell division protease FtsH